MKQNFNVNDFVWAKLYTHPYWPAMIVQPGPDTPSKPRKFNKECFYWVYFFGTHNYNWIEECNVKDYYMYKDVFADLYKTTSFKKSVQEIQDHAEQKKNNSNYHIPIISLIKPNKRRKLQTENNFGLQPKKFKTVNSSTCSKFGIIGIGNIGDTIRKNLVRSGQKINIWNRNPKRFLNLRRELGDKHYLNRCMSPRFVLINSEIVFICVADYKIAIHIIQQDFGMNNATDNIMKGKGVVVMGGIDPEISKDINNMIKYKGGRYLEAQIQQADTEIHEEKFLLLTGGDSSLFIDCQICFKSVPFEAIYFGEIGYASTINVILQMVRGILLTAISEGIKLADLCGFEQEKFMEIVATTSLSCRFLINNITNILQRQFKTTEQSLQQLQNDIQLGLEISAEKGQPMMTAATTANEIFKECIASHYGSFDAVSLYMKNYNRTYV